MAALKAGENSELWEAASENPVAVVDPRIAEISVESVFSSPTHRSGQTPYPQMRRRGVEPVVRSRVPSDVEHDEVEKGIDWQVGVHTCIVLATLAIFTASIWWLHNGTLPLS
jgi:hypothetical protein